MPRSLAAFVFLLLLACIAAPCVAQAPPEQLQIMPPMRRIGPPPASWTTLQLEKQGDDLRADKAYVDALDYYQAALDRKPSAVLQNKIGITYLQMQRFAEASKAFQRSTRADRNYADAHNNLGVIYYLQKKYGKAIKQYQKALKLAAESASFTATWRRLTSPRSNSSRQPPNTRGRCNWIQTSSRGPPTPGWLPRCPPRRSRAL